MARWLYLKSSGLMVLPVWIALAGCAAAHPEDSPDRLRERATADASEADAPSHLFMGVPQTSDATVIVLERTGYEAGFSKATRTPLWVSYRLFAVPESTEAPRPDVDFDDDPDIGLPDLNHESYTNSGYDRGHMAPSSGIGRCYGEAAQLQTFIVSNICPQHPGCNQRAWERFENKESHDYAARLSQVWVVTGPVFDADAPCEELLSGVRIPAAFYKIVVALIEDEPEMLAIVMPNARTNAAPVRHYLTTVDAIEARTGIDFFHELADDVEAAAETDDTPHEAWHIDDELTPTFPGTARSIRKQACP